MTLTSTSESSIQVTSPGNSSPSYFTITHSPVVKFSTGSWGWASSLIEESCSVVELVGGVTLVLRIRQTRKHFSISLEISATLTSSAPEVRIQWTLCVWETAITPSHYGIQKCRLLINLTLGNEFNLNVRPKLFGECWILLWSGDMTSLRPNVSPNCPLHCHSGPVYDIFSMRCGKKIPSDRDVMVLLPIV